MIEMAIVLDFLDVVDVSFGQYAGLLAIQIALTIGGVVLTRMVKDL